MFYAQRGDVIDGGKREGEGEEKMSVAPSKRLAH